MTKEVLLLKLKALAQRGVGGEKENAGEILKRLMAKYDISEDDLNEDRVELHWFACKVRDLYEPHLMSQVMYMVTGKGCYSHVGKYANINQLACYCTPAQVVEIEACFSFYKQALQEESKVFFRAFVMKHNLFPEPTAETPLRAPDEMDYRAARMSAGITRHEFRKQIEGLKENESN